MGRGVISTENTKGHPTGPPLSSERSVHLAGPPLKPNGDGTEEQLTLRHHRTSQKSSLDSPKVRGWGWREAGW